MVFLSGEDSFDQSYTISDTYREFTPKMILLGTYTFVTTFVGIILGFIIRGILSLMPDFQDIGRIMEDIITDIAMDRKLVFALMFFAAVAASVTFVYTNRERMVEGRTWKHTKRYYSVIYALVSSYIGYFVAIAALKLGNWLIRRF